MKRILILLFSLSPVLAMAQLELPFSVKNLNPRPLDFYYFNTSGTAYTNTAQVISQVGASVRYRGMTFNVAGVEYWFEAGTADGDLVIKSSGWRTSGSTLLAGTPYIISDEIGGLSTGIKFLVGDTATFATFNSRYNFNNNGLEVVIESVGQSTTTVAIGTTLSHDGGYNLSGSGNFGSTLVETDYADFYGTARFYRGIKVQAPNFSSGPAEGSIRFDITNDVFIGMDAATEERYFPLTDSVAAANRILFAVGGGNLYAHQVGFEYDSTAKKLLVENIQLPGGSPGVGKVLTGTDANGNANWQTLAGFWGVTGTTTLTGDVTISQGAFSNEFTSNLADWAITIANSNTTSSSAGLRVSTEGASGSIILNVQGPSSDNVARFQTNRMDFYKPIYFQDAINDAAGTDKILLYDNTNKNLLKLGIGSGLSVSGGNLTATGGFTNGAANNELMKSNGTDAVSSSIFSPAAGDVTFGNGSLAGSARSFVADGSASAVGFGFTTKGAGGFTFSLGSSSGQFRFVGSSTREFAFQPSANKIGFVTSIPTTAGIIHGSEGYSNGGTNTVGVDLILRGGNGNSGGTGAASGGHLYLMYGAKSAQGGSDANIGMLTSSVANWQSLQRGIYVADRFAAPTGNPSGGFFHYSESGVPTWLTSGGETYTFSNYLHAPLSVTGTAIQFDRPRMYGISSAETGNFTLNTTGLLPGITQVVRHNNSTKPTFSSDFKVITDNYQVSQDNWIFLYALSSSVILVTMTSEL